MKKLLALIIVALMLLSLVACELPGGDMLGKESTDDNVHNDVNNGNENEENNDNNNEENNNSGIITDMSEVIVDGVILRPVNSNAPQMYCVHGYVGESTEVVIPDSYNGFPVGAIWTMDANTSITSVVISESVEQILDYAFRGCSSLEEVYIPSSVWTIGGGAFSGCSSLKKITVPFVGNHLNVKDKEMAYPFGYIFGEEEYEGSVVSDQFYCPAMALNSGYIDGQFVREHTKYYIPESLTEVTVLGGTLYYGAFYKCKTIKSITIGDGVDRIGMSAFTDCAALETVTIGTGIKEIGSGAFTDCKALTGVYISDLEAWQSITFLGNNLATDPLYYAKNLYLNGELVTAP